MLLSKFSFDVLGVTVCLVLGVELPFFVYHHLFFCCLRLSCSRDGVARVGMSSVIWLSL
jgi:hypothetical protein